MRNVFISYAHRLDQDAADDFIRIFGSERSVFSDRSLSGDIGSLADNTIKDLYIRPKIKNSSVTIILIGAETSKRWWIDWEIYYSLLKTTGNDRNGILGIRIPNKSHNVPARLLRNSHMSEIIDWPRDKRTLEAAIERVYNLRDQNPDLKDSLRVRNS
jgi:hypothetical protein